MAKKYLVHTTVISGFFFGVALFAYLLVSHHLSMPNSVLYSRDGLLRNGLSVLERIKPVGKVVMESPIKVAGPNASISAVTPSRDGAQVFSQSCAACHALGIAGAPKLGDQVQWKRRLDKGTKILYFNALNGISSPTGVMPAKGGNTALTDTEVKAAVDYIVAKAKAN
jgi:cytochrome c5